MTIQESLRSNAASRRWASLWGWPANGATSSVVVIAEAGVNHNGDLGIALRMVDAAVDAGVDAIKFQTFSADRLASRAAPKADYQRQTTGDAGSQHAMLKALELSYDAHREIQSYCRKRGIVFMSTPFDEVSADFLALLDVPVYKLSSGDLTNHPMISHVCRKGKPVILSTGMATLDEVTAAVDVAKNERVPLSLLQCVSNYPADPPDVNLRVMADYRRRFGVPAGYSDHTLGTTVAIGAAAAGAAIIEKHFTLDRSLPGPDHRASLDPRELVEMVRGIRLIESALGDGIKQPLPSELAVRDVGRKSLHWRSDLSAGTVVSEGNMIALRPGTGISPARIASVAGKRLARPVRTGELVRTADLE